MMIAFYLACVLVGIVVGVLIGFEAPAPQFIDNENEANQWANALLMSEFRRVQPAPPRSLDAQFALAICGMSRTTPKRVSEPLSAQAQEALRLLGALQIAQENGFVLPDVANEASTGIMSQQTHKEQHKMKTICIQKPTVGLLITWPDKKDVFLYGDDIDHFWQGMPTPIYRRYIKNGRVRLNVKSHAAWRLSDYRLIAQDIDQEFYDRNGLKY